MECCNTMCKPCVLNRNFCKNHVVRIVDTTNVVMCMKRATHTQDSVLIERRRKRGPSEKLEENEKTETLDNNVLDFPRTSTIPGLHRLS